MDALDKNHTLPTLSLNVPFNGWLTPAIRLSDHASFWDQGFKAVMITDTAFYSNPHYHPAIRVRLSGTQSLKDWPAKPGPDVAKLYIRCFFLGLRRVQ